MRTSSQDSLHRTQAAQQAQQASQEQRVQQATVQNVSGQHQGVVETSQLPGAFPTEHEGAPAPFRTPAALAERADTLRRQMLHHDSSVREPANQENVRRPANLAQAKERMLIEGEYLKANAEHAGKTGHTANAFVSFDQMARELGLTSVLADEVDRIHTQFTSDIDNILNESKKRPDEGPGHLIQSMRAAVRDQAALFAKRDAVYEEVLNQDLSKSEREAVQTSQLSFSFYATEVGSKIPNTLENTLSHANGIVSDLQNRKAELEKSQGDKSPEVTQLAAQIEDWSKAAKELEQMKTDLLPDFTAAVDLNKLAQHINTLNESSGSVGNQLHAFVGQGVRQMILSGAALGAANAFTEAALSNWPAAQPFVGGLATALAHDFATHFLARGALDLIGGATRAVTPGEVSEQGVVRERTPAEIESKKEQDKAMLTQLKQTQNAHKLGAASAEAQFWSMFGGAQGGRGLFFDSTEANQPGGATLSSMVAGFGMGGKQGAGGMRASIKDGQNRAIPAYTMAPKPSDGSTPAPSEQKTKLAKTADWMKQGVEQMNYLKPGPRKTLENKTGSLASGMALGKIGGAVVDAVADSSTGVKIFGEGAGTGMKSPLLLAVFWGGAQLGSIVQADQKAAGGQAHSYDRFIAAWRTMTDPDRAANPHVFDAGSISRALENTYDRLQAAAQLPHTAVFDTLEAAPGAIKAAIPSRSRGTSGDQEDIEMQTSPQRTNPSHDASDRV